MKTIIRLMHCRRGATAIEYGLIAGGIAVAIAAVVFTIGGDANTIFTSISTKLKTAPTL